MTIDILTLFPSMFKGPFEESIIKRAREKGLIKINIHNLRDWADDRHQTVDDSPYGGGAGMVLRIDVLDRAINSLKSKIKNQKPASLASRRSRPAGGSKIILLTPQGKQFNQKTAKTLSSCSDLLLITGHYEGFDERVRKLVDEEISIGPYVLTGGEIPAMVVVDTVIRLIPGVLGKDESAREDSFSMERFLTRAKRCSSWNEQSDAAVGTSKAILEYPHYTRPPAYQPINKKFKRPLRVPKILLSGDHEQINQWRLGQAVSRTKKWVKNNK